MGTSRKWRRLFGTKSKLPISKRGSKDEQSVQKPSKWHFLMPCYAIDRGTIHADDNGDVQIKHVSSKGVGIDDACQEEQAAICIQTVFRGFLARRALCALKCLAWLQANVSDQDVRKQSVGTLHCIQDYVRMQARICAQRALKNNERIVSSPKVTGFPCESQPRETEGIWIDTLGTIEEIRARMQQRQEAAMKRERAMAYAFSDQWRVKNKSESFFDHEMEKSLWTWLWLDHWLSEQPVQREILKKNPEEKVAARKNTRKKTNLKKATSFRVKKPCSSKFLHDASKHAKPVEMIQSLPPHGYWKSVQNVSSKMCSKSHYKRRHPDKTT